MSRVYFNQRDNRWAYKMYSVTGNQNQTIKSSGCGPTSSAMVVSSLTGNTIYPDEMADYYVKSGFRTTNDGTSWTAFSATADKYQIEFKQTSDINVAVDCINNGGIVVANARGGNTALFSTNGHYVVLVGLQGSNFVIYDSDLYNGKYQINGRNTKATVNGNEVYVSIENTRIEARQYFCFYSSGNSNNIDTTAKYVRVNTALNIRNGAGTENTVIGTLSNNTLVTVYEQTNGFSRIGDGKWVSSEYLKDTPSGNSTNKVMVVTAKTGLNVRQQPNTNAKIVTAYKQGTRVTIYEITNGWARGIRGWMKAQYLA